MPNATCAQQPYVNENLRFAVRYPEYCAIEETSSAVSFTITSAQGLVGALMIMLTDYATIGEAINSAKVPPTGTTDFKVISERQTDISNVQGFEIIRSMTLETSETHPRKRIGLTEKVVVVRRYVDVFYIVYAAFTQVYAAYLSEANDSIQSFRFFEDVTLSAEPKITSLAVDGTTYSAEELPRSLRLEYGKSYTLFAQSTISGPEGTRSAFDSWSDGNTNASRRITITRSGEIIARYKLQFELKVVSEQGNPQGAGWYDQGTVANFFVTSVPVSGFMGVLGGRLVLDRWRGDSTSSTPTSSVTMDRPKTVTAVWREDYTTVYALFGVFATIIILTGVAILKKGKSRTKPS